MALLKIIEYPDPFLTLKAKPVEKIDEEILKLIKDMAETMFNAPGVGLAAPQVKSDKRIIVYNPNAKDANDEKNEKENGNKPSEVSNQAIEEAKQTVSEKQAMDKQGNGNNHQNNSRNNEAYRAIINPEIIAASGSLISENEACLSVPDYSANVKRFSKVTVKGLNIDGKKIQFDAEDIHAVILQHEIDHLEGILYIDRISLLKRNMYKKKILKRAKEK